jgi:hypothetical protein
MLRFLFLSLPLLFLLTACPTPAPDTSKPTITSFTATPTTLPAGGGSVTLSWDVKDATSLSIDNGVGTVTGTSRVVNVTSTTTFTLTATNADGSTTQTTSVSVEAGPDTTLPAVSDLEPGDGATGVLDEQRIRIFFSEPMNQTATEAAYESADLPASEVSFSWSSEGDVLTVTPNDLLEYAAGDDPSIAAKTYTFGFSEGAIDLAGNALEAFSSSFSTLKVIVVSIYATASLDGDCYGSGDCDTSRETFAVGDLATAPTDSGYRSFVSFDLTSIPEGVVTDESRLIIYKELINFNSGNPYPLGDMILEQVEYRDFLFDDYDAAVVSDLGIFDSASQPESGYLASDVTTAVNDDLTYRLDRGNRSQYRLRFPIENNDNNASDYVAFTSGDGPEGQRPFLNIVYYIP